MALVRSTLTDEVVTPRTTVRSILRTSTGQRVRQLSEPEAVPKSSTDSRSPRDFSSSRLGRGSGSAVNSRLSQSSRSMSRGSRPVSAMTRATTRARSPSVSCPIETLTERRRSASPARCQLATCRQAEASTHSPIGPIRPVASASDRNPAAARSPDSGCRQRSSASTPTMRPEASSTCG